MSLRTVDTNTTGQKVAGTRPVDLFSIYLIFPAGLGPGVCPVSNRNKYQKQKNNISGEYSAGLRTLPVSRLSRQCGNLNFLQPYSPPRLVTEIVLFYFTDINKTGKNVYVLRFGDCFRECVQRASSTHGALGRLAFLVLKWHEIVLTPWGSLEKNIPYNVKSNSPTIVAEYCNNDSDRSRQGHLIWLKL
jgi:hypothetical protein